MNLRCLITRDVCEAATVQAARRDVEALGYQTADVPGGFEIVGGVPERDFLPLSDLLLEERGRRWREAHKDDCDCDWCQCYGQGTCKLSDEELGDPKEI